MTRIESYIDRGRVDPELESYAIDGSVMKGADGKLYWLYTTGEIAIMRRW